MKTTTRISSEDTREYNFYTMFVECKSEEAMDSLTEYLESFDFEAEGCGEADEDGFAAYKGDFNNKAHFEKEFRAAVKTWKSANR